MKLTYFNIRGLAETSRILLAIMGQDYEDFRYPLNIIDLATFNMEKTEFDAAKKEGKLLAEMTLSEMDIYWEEAKKAEKN